MPTTLPAYVLTHDRGRLRCRVEQAHERLSACTLCPRQCGVNRLEGERGACRTGRFARVCSAGPHFGEEAGLVGAHGSGTIFFSHCNLLCLFCQNFEISHGGEGTEVTAGELAGIMLSLQRQGCHNINLVMPADMAGTRPIMEFLAHEVSARTYVNVMSQYRPCGRAAEVPGLEAPLTPGDYRRALDETLAAGISRLDGPPRGRLRI